MPFYEYECQACKYYLEVMQKITDPPLTRCPSCGKRRLRKLVSAPAFRLKGGGWYETDFKSDKENKRNLLGAEKEEPRPDGKPEAKEPKDTKPEGKEAKEAKEATEPGEPKPSTAAEPKASAGGGAAAGRSRVILPGKGARAATARRTGRTARARGGARRGRR